LSELTVNGDSEVSMRFNANSKDDLAPINEVASGGEVSRLMLGLKSILSEADEIPTMIFDEIDTGVSGEVAKRIGALMKSIGSKTQIIAVTHLPGVAAKGQHHFKIVKSEKQGKVVSTLVELDKAKRVEELAAMFTGDHLTEASLESARLLLEDV
jgi:DNA repair protein RecN (Recombination protein N)